MQNQKDITKFEFLLTLEGNIIIQRFFNVMDYNPRARRSMDLHYSVKNICEEISEDLKIKSSDYMSENPNYFYGSEVSEENEENKEEYFLLEVKLGDDVFISRIFPAHYYHPKARYSVDVRPKIRKILSELTDILSSEELETTYLQYEL
jgi:hypothetical protein